MRKTLFVFLLLLVSPFGPARTSVSMAPSGTIKGTVFDSNGKPIRNSVVGLLRVVNQAGARSVRVVDAQSTDGRGEFRIQFVPPGEYYVGAAPPSTATQVTTLYPSAANLDSASKIVVNGAEEIAGVDIRVRSIP